MATDKKSTTKNDEVEVLDKAPEREATLSDGVYTEKGVKLNNGVEIEISVIVDKDMLPASMSSLVHEGNMEGALMAQLTPNTRRLLDLVGATRKDLREVIAEVINRGTDAADD